MKGRLIRTICFPEERRNEFEKEVLKFLLFLLGLAVLTCVIVGARMKNQIEYEDLVEKFLDLIVITASPGLPISLTFNIVFIIFSMEEKQIYCTSPSKVTVGGQVDLICFDKTGTLTEDSMDFKCLVTGRGKEFG